VIIESFHALVIFFSHQKTIQPDGILIIKIVIRIICISVYGANGDRYAT